MDTSTTSMSLLTATSSFQEALATSSLAAPQALPSADLGIGPYMIQLLIVTLLMLGLGYVALRLTRNGPIPGFSARSKGIKVLDRLNIDHKRALMVVNVGQRNFLVGMTDASFQSIAELSAEDAAPDFAQMVESAEPHEGKRPWWRQALGLGLMAVAMGALFALPAAAQGMPANPFTSFDLREPLNAPNMTTSVGLIFLLASLTVLPFLVIMTTSFMRTIIVLGFLRQALGTQSIPPNPVMLGLALFLSMYTMAPVWESIDKSALQPYFARQVSQQVMMDRAQAPLKEFMIRQTAQQELAFFVRLSRTPAPNTAADVPLHVVIPAFMVSELTTAFKIGFIIYIPFIVIDLVVSNVLLALGMSSLPPQMISNAFKLLVFTLANGWHLVMSALVQSFK